MKNKKIFLTVLFNSISYNFFINSSSPAALSSNSVTPNKQKIKFFAYSTSPTPINLSGSQTPKKKSTDIQSPSPTFTDLSPSRTKNDSTLSIKSVDSSHTFTPTKKQLIEDRYFTDALIHPDFMETKIWEDEDIKEEFNNIKKFGENLLEELNSFKRSLSNRDKNFENKHEEYSNKNKKINSDKLTFKFRVKTLSKAIIDNFKQNHPDINLQNKDILPTLTKLEEQVENLFSSVNLFFTNFSSYKEHKDKCNLNKLSDFFNKEQFIPAFKFLDDPLLDNSIPSIIKNYRSVKMGTPTDYGILYVNFAHGLYHEMQEQNIFEYLSFNQKFYYENKLYLIKNWNLLHVFLGSWSNQKFTGLHFKSEKEEYSQFFDSLYKFVKIENKDNECLNGFVFYKINNLFKSNKDEVKNNYYFIKRCSLFPSEFSMHDCVASCTRALLNIKGKKIWHNLYNFIGIDKIKNLKIEISYDPLKETIESFFPTFDGFEIYEKYISEIDYSEFRKKLTLIPQKERSFEKIKELLNNSGAKTSTEGFSIFQLTKENITPTPEWWKDYMLKTIEEI